MRGLLDDERLNGPHEVHVSFRPERKAFPIPTGAVDQAIETIEAHCQVWGGATLPLIPLTADGTVPAEYARILPGAAIDRVIGLDPVALGSGVPLQPQAPSGDKNWWGSHFSPALLRFRRQDSYAVLEVVELPRDDPWRPVYAACLGRLPKQPTPELLRVGNLKPELTFEDFLRVERVQVSGSMDDLVARLSSDGRFSPRQLSMVHLPYGDSGRAWPRRKSDILPSPGFDRHDAGPSIIVLCCPGSLDDVALLWNLRGALGDSGVLPIGLPLEAASPEVIQPLIAHPRIARDGSPYPVAYVTSASLTVDAIGQLLSSVVTGPHAPIAISPLSEMLCFGEPGGWHRDEVLVWNDGRAHVTPMPHGTHAEVFQRGYLSDLTRMALDVAVPSHPFPTADDIRIDNPGSATFAAGCRTTTGRSAHSRADVQQIEWPSSMLMARAIARRRGLDLAESEPGRACRVLLAGFDYLSDVSLLAHAPLLELLEQMAARHGFGWYKERLRCHEEEADPTSAVPSTTDDLSDKAFNEFKKALGNSEPAAKYWLLWAERAGLIIKGLPLKCVKCRAKQWIPVNGFAPPIVCRGCGESMETPFGDRPTVNFSYRLSERLRRVYAQDAIGHLLVAHFFDSIFRDVKSGHLVGLHPGMEVRVAGAESIVGEADVLMLTRRGEFIPVEVKRRGTGLIQSEVAKLDTLANTLTAPWSAVVACEYAARAKSDLTQLVVRHEDGPYKRMVLTFDRLLDPAPYWSMGHDPFGLKPLTADDIVKREKSFVEGLLRKASDGASSALEYDLLHPYNSDGAR